jgi:NADPH:quinone reductase-like Zn-dependent oxidoreductase
MKAIIYKKYGKPDVLEVVQVTKPVPQEKEILIKIQAVEATKSDCELRSFNFSVSWFWLPLRLVIGIFKPRLQRLGSYFSGEIEAVGSQVTQFKPGQQVFGVSKMHKSAYAEYICLPENFPIVDKPTNATYVEAASVPLGGLNALHFLTRANINKGDKVLVNGAGGSIGLYGVQIAKALGAEVTAVDHEIKQPMLQRIGADHFIDYTKQDFTKSGESYDVIFDMVVNSSYSACIKMLKPGGCYLIGNPRMSDMLRSILTSKFSDKKAYFAFAGEKLEELETLKRMLEAGEIKPVVDKVFSLEHAAKAHLMVETEQRCGVIVLAINAS